jgi:hypothetical protein
MEVGPLEEVLPAFITKPSSGSLYHIIQGSLTYIRVVAGIR